MTREPKPGNGKNPSSTAVAYGIPLGAGFGVAFGAAFGAALGNIGLGVALGVALGPALGFAIVLVAKRKSTGRMTSMHRVALLACGLALIVLLNCQAVESPGDPLPSWNDGPAKQSILDFVANVTTDGSSDFIAAAERIAVFDNDGTLWAEKPLYFQLVFALDRVKSLAPSHPEWATTQPFQAVLEDDLETLHAGGEHALLELVMATHAGTTTDEFAQIVKEWLATAKHPRSNRPYTEMVYQPMLELLAYLRANGFKTYIVSGGGIEFMRPWTEAVYGIPPEQVIGSSIKTKLESREKQPVLVRLPEINFIDDKAGKPVAINQHIGRRPIAAFGNSDGDLEMLQWVAAGDGETLCLYVHHTDAEREWAYDRESSIGRLARGLDEAAANGWTIVDMMRDWGRMFPE